MLSSNVSTDQVIERPEQDEKAHKRGIPITTKGYYQAAFESDERVLDKKLLGFPASRERPNIYDIIYRVWSKGLCTTFHPRIRPFGFWERTCGGRSSRLPRLVGMVEGAVHLYKGFVRYVPAG